MILKGMRKKGMRRNGGRKKRREGGRKSGKTGNEGRRMEDRKKEMMRRAGEMLR